MLSKIRGPTWTHQPPQPNKNPNQAIYFPLDKKKEAAQVKPPPIVPGEGLSLPVGGGQGLVCASLWT